MTNKKRKGFTIVELVIVIAVIAILAGVLIPTFASIIDKANQSSDIQAVRQMNVLLKAESVDKTLSIGDVINIVSEAGYDTEEKLTPKSKGHSFYWYETENVIILVKDKVDETAAELIYPLDNEELTAAVNGADVDVNENNKFYNLKEYSGAGGEVTNTIDNAKDLITALGTAGKTGTITLGADITLSRDNNELYDEYVDGEYKNFKYDKVEILCTAGTDDNPLIIDLNGKTLTIGECASAVIEGNIKIIDTANDADTDIIIPFFDKLYFNKTNSLENKYRDYFRAFYVLKGGTLSLENLDIDAGRTGQSSTNIYNEGTVNLNGINFKLNGYSPDSFKNIAITNCGDDATIIEGSFSAEGEKAQAIDGQSGSMTINGTQFFDSISNEDSQIQINMIEWRSDGTLTLTNAKFNDSDKLKTNTYGIGVAASAGTVEISGGTYYCSLSFAVSSEAKIEERLKNLSEKDIEALNIANFNGLVSCSASATIYGGNFSGGFNAGSYSKAKILGGTFKKTVTVGGADSNLTIEGGTFEYDGTIVLCTLGSNPAATVEITGGKFTGKLEVNASSDSLVSRIYFSGDAEILYDDGNEEDYVKVDKLLTELSKDSNNLTPIITGPYYGKTTDGKLLIGTTKPQT